MAIPGKTLGSWSHHRSAMASKQAHVSIRNALASYNGWAQDTEFNIFLQGSYKNATNLRRDSDVDFVVQLAENLPSRVVTLSGSQLEQDQSHVIAYRRWQSFRAQTLNALRATYGANIVTSGRKSLKLAKGRIPASADVVVTLRYANGLAFFLPGEHRWVVSYPQQHYEKGLKKEESTNKRYKRVIRMFKAARNYLVEKNAIEDGTAPSYFIECLLYNIPWVRMDELFRPRLVKSYSGIVDYLSTTNLKQFKCQNGVRELFGSSRADLWSIDKAQKFIRALRRLWEKWPKVGG
jgi:hypothetical protein